MVGQHDKHCQYYMMLISSIRFTFWLSLWIWLACAGWQVTWIGWWSRSLGHTSMVTIVYTVDNKPGLITKALSYFRLKFLFLAHTSLLLVCDFFLTPLSNDAPMAELCEHYELLNWNEAFWYKRGKSNNQQRSFWCWPWSHVHNGHHEQNDPFNSFDKILLNSLPQIHP